MYPIQYIIVATRLDTGERFECFRWCRGAEQGVERAKSEAIRHGMASRLTDYRAEPVGGRA